MQNNKRTNRLLVETTALLSAVLFVILVLFVSSKIFVGEGTNKEVLSIKKASVNQGVIANYEAGLESEIAFMSSLARPDQITLLGSSEFSSNPYASYYFLPKELGMAAVGFGHAFHQSFSMYCELLAGNEFLPNSKVVFFISPTWFETEGTNSEAFLEFVRPNFLEKIWMDEQIPSKYKFEVGHFLSDNLDNFSGINNRMKSFNDFYNGEKYNSFSHRIKQKIETNIPVLKRGTKYQYAVQPNPMNLRNVNYKFSEKFDEVRKSFLLKSATNDIYVDSTYYRLHIPFEDGKMKMGKVVIPQINESRELKDFLLLLELMKKRNVDCSFIIQTLNPYYYENLSDLKPLITLIEGKLKAYNFPYLNMFVEKREDYQIGTLNDIMHLGDLGWLKVNEFLLKTYAK